MCFDGGKAELDSLVQIGALKMTKMATSDEKQLISYVKTIKRTARNDREHPNFISLKDDVFTSNILLPTMFAMINSEVNRGMLI